MRRERGLALDLFHANSSRQSLGQEARARAFAARRPSSTSQFVQTDTGGDEVLDALRRIELKTRLPLA